MTFICFSSGYEFELYYETWPLLYLSLDYATENISYLLFVKETLDILFSNVK